MFLLKILVLCPRCWVDHEYKYDRVLNWTHNKQGCSQIQLIVILSQVRSRMHSSLHVSTYCTPICLTTRHRHLDEVDDHHPKYTPIFLTLPFLTNPAPYKSSLHILKNPKPFFFPIIYIFFPLQKYFGVTQECHTGMTHRNDEGHRKDVMKRCLTFSFIFFVTWFT